jgi:hypothetical protein
MRHTLAIRVIRVEFEADSQSTERRLAPILRSRLVERDPTAAGKENGQQQALRLLQTVRRQEPFRRAARQEMSHRPFDIFFPIILANQHQTKVRSLACARGRIIAGCGAACILPKGTLFNLVRY